MQLSETMAATPETLLATSLLITMVKLKHVKIGGFEASFYPLKSGILETIKHIVGG
jgi:hypothetical protein